MFTLQKVSVFGVVLVRIFRIQTFLRSGGFDLCLMTGKTSTNALLRFTYMLRSNQKIYFGRTRFVSYKDSDTLVFTSAILEFLESKIFNNKKASHISQLIIANTS